MKSGTGAGPRAVGAEPVELMIMSDTCATDRSRVPRRSSGRIKGGATMREDQAWTFILCFVCVSCPRSFILLLNLFENSSHSTNFAT